MITLGKEFDIDLTQHCVSKQQIEEERKEAYEVFKREMLNINDKLSEDIIKEMFKVKFEIS